MHPNLAYAATILLRFNNNPRLTHWHAAKCALQYLKATRSWRLTFEGDGQGRGLKGYADADGISVKNCKAISRYAFLIDSGAVLWLFKQQNIIALSTTKVEYITLTYAGKEALWMQQFISELFLPLHNSIIIHNNNQLALALTYTKLGQFHACTKHISMISGTTSFDTQSKMATYNSHTVLLRTCLLTCSLKPFPVQRQNILPEVLDLFRLKGEFWNIKPYSPVRTLFLLHPNHPLHCSLMDSLSSYLSC